MYEIGQMVTDNEIVGVIIGVKSYYFDEPYLIKWSGHDPLERCSHERVIHFVTRWNRMCEEVCG